MLDQQNVLEWSGSNKRTEISPFINSYLSYQWYINNRFTYRYGYEKNYRSSLGQCRKDILTSILKNRPFSPIDFAVNAKNNLQRYEL